MRPPAVEIRIIKPAAGQPWGYMARLKGEVIDDSDGKVFEHPVKALQAALASVKAALVVPKAPMLDEGNYDAED